MDYAIATKCAMLAQDIYQDFATIRFEAALDADIQLIDVAETDTQLVILQDSGTSSAVIVFRGSQQGGDWATNFNFKKMDSSLIYPYDNPDTPVRMHQGFAKAYLSVRNQLHEQVRHRNLSDVLVTGHSLGGALATICAVDLQYNFGNQLSVAAYTYGSPRVGNKAFSESYSRRVPNSSRFIYGRDIVTRLPRFWQRYYHVEIPFRLGPRFTWRVFSRRVGDHNIAKYIQALREKQSEAELSAPGG